MPRNEVKSSLERIPLAELHSHVGGAVDASILWTLAHEQGIKLPTKNYLEFEKLITVERQYKNFREIDRAKYHWTELIQSSPLAMEPAVQLTLGGAYRSHNVVLHEIRYNPMKRNRGGERDLDHIIFASIRGMERALLEYPEVKAGIILMLDREFPLRLNEIIYQKAIKYQPRGIIGIDVAGPQSRQFRIQEYADLFRDAKKRGFGVTIHTGEEGGLKEMRFVVQEIEPHRIGHGVMAWRDRKLMGLLRDKGITLELCPTSNLRVGVFESIAALRRAYKTLRQAGVKLTINTDGPEMYKTNLWRELMLLLEEKVFRSEEIQQFISNAFAATFIKNGKP